MMVFGRCLKLFRKKKKSYTMGRKEIEKNDEHLIKQIRDIISKKEKKIKPIWKTNPFRLICLFTGLIVAGLVIFGQQTTTIVSNGPEPAARQMSKTNPAQMTDIAQVQAQAQNPPPAPINAPAPEKLTEQNTASDTENTVSTTEAVGKNTPVISQKNNKDGKKKTAQATVLKSREALLKKDRPEESGTTDPSEKPQVTDRPLNIQIHKIVSCGSVIDRQYVSPKSRFSLKEDPTPVVWMTVLSDNPPFTLTHVYYMNDRKYCEVPLSIRYPHMRTWSSVTLNHPEHEGEWRVEVITGSGVKLDQIEFTVVE